MLTRLWFAPIVLSLIVKVISNRYFNTLFLVSSERPYDSVSLYSSSSTVSAGYKVIWWLEHIHHSLTTTTQ